MQLLCSKILAGFLVFLYVCFFFCHTVSAEPVQGDDILGFWYTQKHDGIIEIYSCDHQICGRFHWLKYDKNNGVPRDDQNPDALKRDTPLCNMQFMGGFTVDDTQHYDHGWIYNPQDGQMYGAKMTLIDHNTLDLHGYVFHPLFGASQVWTRAENTPSCNGDSQ